MRCRIRISRTPASSTTRHWNALSSNSFQTIPSSSNSSVTIPRSKNGFRRQSSRQPMRTRCRRPVRLLVAAEPEALSLTVFNPPSQQSEGIESEEAVGSHLSKDTTVGSEAYFANVTGVEVHSCQAKKAPIFHMLADNSPNQCRQQVQRISAGRENFRLSCWIGW